MQEFKSIIYTPIPKSEIYLDLLLLKSFDVFLAMTVLVLFTTQLFIGDSWSILLLLLFISLLIQIKILFDILIAKLHFLWTAVVFMAILIVFFAALAFFLDIDWIPINKYVCLLVLGLVNFTLWKLNSQYIELKNIIASIKD